MIITTTKQALQIIAWQQLTLESRVDEHEDRLEAIISKLGDLPRF